MHRNLLSFIIVIISVFWFAELLKAESLPNEAPIALSITTDKRSYDPGEAVKLFIKIRNITGSPVSLPPGYLLQEGHLWLTMFEREEKVAIRTDVVSLSTGYPVDLILAPGESYTFQWTIPSRYYILPYKAGKYKPCAHYENDYKKYWFGKIGFECVSLEI